MINPCICMCTVIIAHINLRQIIETNHISSTGILFLTDQQCVCEDSVVSASDGWSVPSGHGDVAGQCDQRHQIFQPECFPAARTIRYRWKRATIIPCVISSNVIERCYILHEAL